MSQQRGATATYACASCGQPFTARTADRKRGWARFCSKSCKATKQEQRTGQFRNFVAAGGTLPEGLCFPSPADEDIQP